MPAKSTSSKIKIYNIHDFENYLKSIVFLDTDEDFIVENELTDINFVKNNQDAVIKKMTLRWINQYVSEELLKDPTNVLHLKHLTTSDNCPQWVKEAMDDDYEVYGFMPQYIFPELEQPIIECRNFLYSVAKEYIEEQYKKADNNPNDFCIQLNTLQINTGQYGSMEAVLTAAKSQTNKNGIPLKEWENIINETKPIMDLPDDMHAVRLLTPEALYIESICTHSTFKKEYYSMLSNKKINVYSIRDKNNLPVATIIAQRKTLNLLSGIVGCIGIGNGRPDFKNRPAILEFIEKQKIPLLSGKKDICAFWQKGKLYDLYNMPKNFVIEGNLSMWDWHLEQLPDLSDVTVSGDFSCDSNPALKSLKGCPKRVEGDFECTMNFGLVSLEGAPEYVGGNFNCSINGFHSLIGAPKCVKGHFICSRNNLYTLDGISSEIGGDIDCSFNKLTTLDGLPEVVHGNLICSINKLKCVKKLPRVIEGNFDISENPLQHIEQFPERINGNFLSKNTGFFYFYQNGKFYNLFNLPKNFVIEKDIDISGSGFEELPDLSTITIKGSFNCSRNKLKSLKGAPRVVEGNFDCSYNNNSLSSLKGAPEIVNGDFDCNQTGLITLEGAPKSVGGDFSCYANQLETLRGAPQYVGGYFSCQCCNLNSLEGSPKIVGQSFIANGNNFTSTKGAPKSINGEFICGHRQLHDLDDLPTGITTLDCFDAQFTQSSRAHPNILKCKKFEDFPDTVSIERMVQNYQDGKSLVKSIKSLYDNIHH